MAIRNLNDIKQIQMADVSEEYKAFTEKFKPKHTSDDCFTPDNIFDTVRAWAFERYKLPEDTPVVRPFYPGGDYQSEDYPDNCVVIDNPPFSIASQICRWYQEHGIRFFLFANGLTIGGIAWKHDAFTAVCAGGNIEYDNGANIQTNFITNMSPGIMAETAPDLHKAIEAVNKENVKKNKKVVTKLALPMEVLTAARMNWMSIHGERFCVQRGDAVRISKLDNYKNGVYGSGLLLSERAAAERAAAERVTLSTRELAIQRTLGRSGAPEASPEE